ncbi:hypothetical protein D3C79_522380 [compost metagenome]
MLAPESFALRSVLTLQPANVVAEAARRLRGPLATVALQHFTQQLRIAPAVHEDVMAGVDQCMAVIFQAYQHQAQQWRLQHIEAAPTFFGGQCRERQRKVITTAPVQLAERHTGLAQHYLHRLGLVGGPDEGTTQTVMGLEHSVPSRLEACHIQTCDLDLHLVDVVAVALAERGMEQHALLHRRQWVDVFDLGHRHRQCVELRLAQARQREVRRRQPLRRLAVLDQRRQLRLVGPRQPLDGRAGEHLPAEAERQAQLAAIHLAIEHQPVAQRRQRALLLTCAFGSGHEQRPLIELAIQLAQVVEGDARHRQPGQARARSLVAQVAQSAETDALVRHAAQLFLDLLDRGAQLGGRGQAHRVGAGEPAHRAAQVDVVEQVFAAMAFQLHQRRIGAAPAAHHPGQGGQQQVVDLGAVGRRGLLQQASGQLGIQACLHALAVTVLQAGAQLGLGQVQRRTGQLPLPVGQLAAQACGMLLQAFAPGLEGAGLGRQFRRAARQGLAVGIVQVFQQHAPGHAIDHQVVDHQQQALATVGQVDQHRTQQRALGQVQATLGLFAGRLDFLGAAQRGTP